MAEIMTDAEDRAIAVLNGRIEHATNEIANYELVLDRIRGEHEQIERNIAEHRKMIEDCIRAIAVLKEKDEQ
jgi:chromosome segregation ATPase